MKSYLTYLSDIADGGAFDVAEAIRAIAKHLTVHEASHKTLRERLTSEMSLQVNEGRRVSDDALLGRDDRRASACVGEKDRCDGNEAEALKYQLRFEQIVLDEYASQEARL